MSDNIIKKSFRCNELYQIIIDAGKKVYKYKTDTDVILFGLRLVRNKIKSNLKLPEDEEESTEDPLELKKKGGAINIDKGTAGHDFLQEWKRKNLRDQGL
ncbi:hypothetical protein LCGC14_3015820 [marine sediment metagenome]|uniref:Uncharacterized protein n=1 Tax=marine sediment metagenome TaxID=412755 RepID=A0A0F8ZMX8_9ZZZZ